MTPQPLMCVAGNIGCAHRCEWGMFIVSCTLERNKNLYNRKNVHVVTIFRNVCNVTIWSILKTFLYRKLLQ
jgi:hypothetical protein